MCATRTINGVGRRNAGRFALFTALFSDRRILHLLLLLLVCMCLSHSLCEWLAFNVCRAQTALWNVKNFVLSASRW